MTIENRRFIRFLLDIPAAKKKFDGQEAATFIRQVSVGGCLTDWDAAAFPGDEFRLEIALPNKNFLPLMCKVIYKFDNRGVGVKFHDISRFEQQLLSQIISEKLEEDGLPLVVDPFSLPPAYSSSGNPEKPAENLKEREEAAIEEAIAREN